MRPYILGILAVVLLIACISPAYGGTRHGVFWQGANQIDWTTAEIQTQARELQGTGVNWVVLEVLWGWSEPNGSTPTPQGPQSYFGPTIQAWHNYNFGVLDQVVNEMRARNIQIVIRLDHHPTWAVILVLASSRSAESSIPITSRYSRTIGMTSLTTSRGAILTSQTGSYGTNRTSLRISAPRTL